MLLFRAENDELVLTVDSSDEPGRLEPVESPADLGARLLGEPSLSKNLLQLLHRARLLFERVE